MSWLPGAMWFADAGFTSSEDFEVSVTIQDSPALAPWTGQFGLYAGTASDRHIRGGVIGRQAPRIEQFVVNNNGGWDSDLNFVGSKFFEMGDHVAVTLKRSLGKYALTVKNLINGRTCTLAIPNSEFLEKESDVYVGMFAGGAVAADAPPLLVKEFKVTVWTKRP